MPPSFDLLTQPWLPCLPREGDTPVALSLSDVLAEAHEYRELVADSPLVAVALHRLLLAVLHRAYMGPRDQDQWHALRSAQRFDAEQVRAYLTDPHWRAHFDLFDTERPFYQVPEMEGVAPISVAKLALERASGNNITLFDHTTGETATFTPAEAARYLVAFQLYAVGGGVSTPFPLSDAPLARDYTVLVRGTTLFETLLLNLARYDDETFLGLPLADDAPWWERERDSEPERAGTAPRGYCDYLTWQSRRVHLLYDEGAGAIHQCQVRQNLKLGAVAVEHDPFKAYRKKVNSAPVSRRLNAGKAFWRDSHALLEEASHDGSRPQIFYWLADLFSGREAARAAFDFEVIGYLTDGPQATIMLWRRERLPLPLRYLAPEGKPLRDELHSGLEAAEAVSRLFGTGYIPIKDKSGKPGGQPSPVWVLAKNLLTMPLDATPDNPGRMPDRKDISELAKHFAPERTYWAALEPPFRQFLRDLAQEPEAGQVLEDYVSAVLGNWKEDLRASARRTFDGLAAALEFDERSLRAVGLAQRQFNWLIKQLLPSDERELAPVGSPDQRRERA